MAYPGGCLEMQSSAVSIAIPISNQQRTKVSSSSFSELFKTFTDSVLVHFLLYSMEPAPETDAWTDS